MSLFNENNAPDGGPVGERLTGWGEAERAAPPAHRGRFAAIADRLKNPAVSSPRPVSCLRPALMFGGASVALVAVAAMSLGEQEAALAVKSHSKVATAAPAKITRANSGPPAMLTKTSLIAWDANLSISAGPVFQSSMGGASGFPRGRGFVTVPFVVTAKNNGAALSAKIVVTTNTSMSPRRYEFPVTIPGNGASWRKVIYAGCSAYENDRITLETADRVLPLYSYSEEYGIEDTERRAVAILDERLNVSFWLASGATKDRAHTDQRRKVIPYQARPEDAPDRVAGYDSADMVVLGKGSGTLNAAQWDTLREWVKGGGSVVFIGSGDAAKALEAPVAREMTAPVPSSQTIQLPSLGPDIHADDSRYIAVTRSLGLGRVTVLSFDPFTRAYRDNLLAVASLWDVVSRGSGGVFAARDLRSRAAILPWLSTQAVKEGSPGETAAASWDAGFDPFKASLPPLDTVMYIFLGYFVLVIPGSFVLLKQVRRMQYAWVTGPVLAVLTAGGMGMFTVSLYTAARSERTAGIATMRAGEGTAQFNGVTELYAPLGGRYDLNLQGRERSLSDRGQWGDEPGGSSGSLTTRDTPYGESPMTLNLPNLAFRRVSHRQMMSLGKGVSASLRVSTSGELIGTVDNGTGLTLRGASVVLRGAGKTVKNYDYSGKYIGKKPLYRLRLWSLTDVPPGTHAVHAAPSPTQIDDRYVHRDTDSVSGVIGLWSEHGITAEMQSRVLPAEPLLMAKTSGEPFGPQAFGKSVGGDRSVDVLVRLNPLTADDQSPAPAKGGNTQ